MNRNATSQITGCWTLLDSDREVVLENSWEALREALLSISKSGNTPNEIATLVAPSGETLSIGIAGPDDRENPGLQEQLATIEYNDASQNPPYLVVVGDPTLTHENGGVLVFRFQGQWTEILRRNCISMELMTQIVQHFFLHGTLPDWISWEQV
jgi:hypothetical protein